MQTLLRSSQRRQPLLSGPSGPTAIGPFVFTIPAATTPPAVRYTLYYLFDEGAISTAIPFVLPLGVEHPNAALASDVTIRFSEPIAPGSLAAFITLAREDGGSLVPVDVRHLPNADHTAVTLRTEMPLDDDSIYRITLTAGVIAHALAGGGAGRGAPLYRRLDAAGTGFPRLG